MKSIISLQFLLISLLLSIEFYGQNQAIKGLVLDIQTKKPLPFVNITYNSSNQGFTSDIDGKFSIKDLSKIEFLKLSYVGYASKTIGKNYLLKNPEITIYLVEETYDLNEVVIYPGENPAHRIINKVLENKKLNNPEELLSYSYTSYNKMILTADIESARKFVSDTIAIEDSLQIDTGLLRVRNFLDSQHLFLMESVSERIFKKPGKINEKVIASRVSGFKQPSFILLATQMQSFSFYSEMITLMDSRYISPISSGSTNRYFFNIEDTTYTESGDTVFSISFRPKKNRNFEALKGVLNINTNKYAIQSVVAEPVESEGMVNLKIQQNYKMVDGKHWFPVELNTDLEFVKFVNASSGQNQFNFIGIGKTYISEIKINQDLENVKFKAVELEVENKAYVHNDSIWAKFRHDSLTQQELTTYHKMDSIGKEEHFDLKLKTIKTISGGYVPFYFLDINVLSILDFNVFEGFRPGLGIRTNEKISKFFSVGTYASYGFKDKQWKYGGNLNLNISKENQLVLAFNYRNDVIESSGYRFFDDQLVFSSSEAYRDYFIADMTYIESVTSNFSFRFLKRFKVNLFASQSNIKNKGNYSFYNGYDYDPIASIYRLNETGFQLKYSPNERLANMAGELFSLNPYNSPVVYFNAIRGIKIWGTSFDYLKLEAKINVNFMTKAFGRTNLQLVAAKAFGDLPYFMLYNGHESYYDFTVETANSFASMRMNEFLSDEFVSIHYRQDFGGLLFKGKKFRPKIVLANSVGFGRLNKPELHRGLNFKTMEKGYYESGLLINNIIRQLGFVGYGFGVYYRYGPYSFSNISNNFAYKLSLTFEL
jgi:hypothetical protein